MTKITDIKKLKKLLLAKHKLESALKATEKAIAEIHPGRLPRWQTVHMKRLGREMSQGLCFKDFGAATVFVEHMKLEHPLERHWIEPFDPKKKLTQEGDRPSA